MSYHLLSIQDSAKMSFLQILTFKIWSFAMLFHRPESSLQSLYLSL